MGKQKLTHLTRPRNLSFHEYVDCIRSTFKMTPSRQNVKLPSCVGDIMMEFGDPSAQDATGKINLDTLPRMTLRELLEKERSQKVPVKSSSTTTMTFDIFYLEKYLPTSFASASNDTQIQNGIGQNDMEMAQFNCNFETLSDCANSSNHASCLPWEKFSVSSPESFGETIFLGDAYPQQSQRLLNRLGNAGQFWGYDGNVQEEETDPDTIPVRTLKPSMDASLTAIFTSCGYFVVTFGAKNIVRTSTAHLQPVSYEDRGFVNFAQVCFSVKEAHQNGNLQYRLDPSTATAFFVSFESEGSSGKFCVQFAANPRNGESAEVACRRCLESFEDAIRSVNNEDKLKAKREAADSYPVPDNYHDLLAVNEVQTTKEIPHVDLTEMVMTVLEDPTFPSFCADLLAALKKAQLVIP